MLCLDLVLTSTLVISTLVISTLVISALVISTLVISALVISALVISALVISTLVISTSIGCLSFGKSHLIGFRTAITSLTLLKLHFLTFGKAIKFHSFQIVAMEEEVTFLLCLDKPITTVHERFDCTFWHKTPPF